MEGCGSEGEGGEGGEWESIIVLFSVSLWEKVNWGEGGRGRE